MPRRGSKKVPRVPKSTGSPERLAKALAKRTKAELIEALVETAKADRGILRRLETRFGVEAPSEELVAATRQAIADATDFDEREINYNFDYDYEGMMTEDVEKCLQVVIKALEKSDLPPQDVLAWCAEMRKKDRVGFICQKQLRALQDRFDTSRSP